MSKRLKASDFAQKLVDRLISTARAAEEETIRFHLYRCGSTLPRDREKRAASALRRYIAHLELAAKR